MYDFSPDFLLDVQCFSEIFYMDQKIFKFFTMLNFHSFTEKEEIVINFM